MDLNFDRGQMARYLQTQCVLDRFVLLFSKEEAQEHPISNGPRVSLQRRLYARYWITWLLSGYFALGGVLVTDTLSQDQDVGGFNCLYLGLRDLLSPGSPREELTNNRFSPTRMYGQVAMAARHATGRVKTSEQTQAEARQPDSLLSLLFFCSKLLSQNTQLFFHA